MLGELPPLPTAFKPDCGLPTAYAPRATPTQPKVAHGLVVSGALNRREESECAKSAVDQLDVSKDINRSIEIIIGRQLIQKGD